MPSESTIENQFIHILSEQENQWRYRPELKTEADLWDNFRNHLNRLNTALLEGDLLTDVEFDRVRVEFLRLTSSPFLASQWLRGENGVAQILLERETGERISLEVFRNKDIAGGTSAYEVVNQIVPDTERSTRGDVTLLINGLPIIHIELKKNLQKMVTCKLIIRFSGMLKMVSLTVFMRQRNSSLFRTRLIHDILLVPVKILMPLISEWLSFCSIGVQKKTYRFLICLILLVLF